MTPQDGAGGADTASGVDAGTLPPVPSWSVSQRAGHVALPAVLTLTFLFLATSLDGLAAQHPVLRILCIAVIVGSMLEIVDKWRVRVLLQWEGLVIDHTVRRTRIPWARVQEVRVRGLDTGSGWVEVVRDNGRKVVLPAPVEAYGVVKRQWEDATRGPGGSHVGQEPPSPS